SIASLFERQHARMMLVEETASANDFAKKVFRREYAWTRGSWSVKTRGAPAGVAHRLSDFSGPGGHRKGLRWNPAPAFGDRIPDDRNVFAPGLQGSRLRVFGGHEGRRNAEADQGRGPRL